MAGYVYMLATRKDGVLYIGVTNNIERRLYEHVNELMPGFTRLYHVHRLVYVEVFNHIETAIQREKQLKGWTRKKKIGLFIKENPDWEDISESWNK